jgi:hypothetical protein
MTIPLVERVVEARIGMIKNEISELFPNANIEVTNLQDDRAVIKMIEEGSVIGMEFVETVDTWDDPKRYRDYYIALVNKCRLGVIVPNEHALRARLRMLEFNQLWLFYYQVYSYDFNGNLKKIGRPYDDGTRSNPTARIPGYV